MGRYPPSSCGRLQGGQRVWVLAIEAGASGSQRALLWAAGACSLCEKRTDNSPTIGTDPRERSTTKLAYPPAHPRLCVRVVSRRVES